MSRYATLENAADFSDLGTVIFLKVVLASTLVTLLPCSSFGSFIVRGIKLLA
jgi:hypothetical protein